MPPANPERFDDRKPARWSALRGEAERLAAPLPPLLVESERIAATVAQGVHGRRRVGAGDAFWQFRRYREGDPSMAVDWRQSAKSQHLFVRENEWEAADSVFLWRDASPSMDYRSDFAPVRKVERATVLLLALASLLVRAGERIALLGEPYPPAGGRLALRRAAHRLSETMTAKGDVPPDTRIPRYAKLVAIGDFLAPVETVAATVRAYAAKAVEGHLVQVLDPAEEDLPFAGRTRFEGVEDDAALLFGRAENVRTPYRARLKAHRLAIAGACRRCGWTFAVHRTDRGPEGALLALYAALAREHHHLTGLGVA